MEYLLVGLGNIGNKYQNTRHNIGFSILDRIAKKNHLSFSREHLAYMCKWQYKNKHIYLLKPTTYMNESGKAFSFWKKKLRLPLCHTLTVADDMTLPLGKLRIRCKGSSGGHNGLNSIKIALKTDSYPRLRFGIRNISPREKRINYINYVLESFSPEENDIIESPILKSVQSIATFCDYGIEKAMNYYN